MPIKIALNLFLRWEQMSKYKDRFFEFYFLSNDTSDLYDETKNKSKKIICSYYDFIVILKCALQFGWIGKIVVIERIYKKSPTNKKVISTFEKDKDFWVNIRVARNEPPLFPTLYILSDMYR